MKKPTVISLFSGAGGLDYGFEAAGFDTRVVLEMDPDACRTLSTNRPDWTLIPRDIHSVTSEEILEKAGLKKEEATLLIGGPPCQPFSKAGYWSRGDSLRLDDPRANTLAEYLRVLEDTLPECFVLENVEGMAYRNKDEGLQLLLDAINAINRRTGAQYDPKPVVMNAADYGVPQLRKRLIIVGTRTGQTLDFPRTHGEEPGLERFRTAWDALGDVEPGRDEDLEVRGKWAKLLPSIPEGHNYLWHTDRMKGKPLFGWRRRYWSFLLKLAKAQPSWTIQAQPGPAIGPFHWENRRLSMREVCRLQTFPDTVTVLGSRLAIQKQVGNAVPSLLAEVLGRGIRHQLLKDKVLGKPRLLPPVRRSTPEPERTARVPREFLALQGKHAPHAGTGRGPAALRRATSG